MDRRTDEQKQPYFPIYRETAQMLDLLDADQAGILVKAAATYFLYRESSQIADRRLANIMQEWERKIDESRESYHKRCEANRTNCKKGGRPSKPVIDSTDELPDPF